MCGIGWCVGARRAGPVLGFALLLLLAGSVGAIAQSVALSEAGGNEIEAPGPKPPPPPPPSSPAARFLHAFTSNGSSVAGGPTCAPGQSRLYLFGGDDEEYTALDDLWIYCVGGGWYPAPIGRSKPGKRKHVGWSCGGGQCVAANGWSGSPLKETWIYDEPSGSWSRLNCRKDPCPPARWGTTIAYDPSRQYHVLFGGLYGREELADTHTLKQGEWTLHQPTTSPAARYFAAMAFVPSHSAVVVDKVVLHGGVGADTKAWCDLHAWTGTTWQRIISTNHGPCLYSHDMAWVDDVEGLGPGLIVTGGYVFDGECGTPNETLWYFLFTSSTSGYWRVGLPLSCDVTPIPPGARMVLDAPSQKKVFFGGFDAEQLPNSVPVDTLAVCQ